MKYKSYVSLLRTYPQFLFPETCELSDGGLKNLSRDMTILPPPLFFHDFFQKSYKIFLSFLVNGKNFWITWKVWLCDTDTSKMLSLIFYFFFPPKIKTYPRIRWQGNYIKGNHKEIQSVWMITITINFFWTNSEKKTQLFF